MTFSEPITLCPKERGDEPLNLKRHGCHGHVCRICRRLRLKNKQSRKLVVAEFIITRWREQTSFQPANGGFIISLSPKLYSCHLAFMLFIAPAVALLVNSSSSNVGADLSTLGYPTCLTAGFPVSLSCSIFWLCVIIFVSACSAWATNAIRLENLYGLA